MSLVSPAAQIVRQPFKPAHLQHAPQADQDRLGCIVTQRSWAGCARPRNHPTCQCIRDTLRLLTVPLLTLVEDGASPCFGADQTGGYAASFGFTHPDIRQRSAAFDIDPFQVAWFSQHGGGAAPQAGCAAKIVRSVTA
jgi:hypothetical protein